MTRYMRRVVCQQHGYSRLWYPCDGLRSALDVRYCRCSDRCRVSVRFVRFNRFVGVSSNED